ncbi:hypothetical protein WA026_015882 [Henosepilachna vigintioctopunctata]|uniref:Uncharacterized protein n=1 Tax=Henosepilachna vigintioctopunctata TaxID=420089 RepID=A0AAW1UYX2_9CUCU
MTIIKEENKEIKQKVDELEQVAKLESLRFYAVQESGKKDLKKIVGNIVTSKLEVEHVIIRECYRIGKNSGSKPRVVMVKFENQESLQQEKTKKLEDCYQRESYKK